jgi:hypothetical protein
MATKPKQFTTRQRVAVRDELHVEFNRQSHLAVLIANDSRSLETRRRSARLDALIQNITKSGPKVPQYHDEENAA